MVTIAQLQKELEEKDEEIQEWKVKCMRAEAEVRALKKQTRHAVPSIAIHERSPAQSWVDANHSPRLFCLSDSLDAARSSHPATPISARSSRDFGVQKNAEASAALDSGLVAKLRQELQSMEQQKQILETSHEELRATCESQEGGVGKSQEEQELRQQLTQRSQAMMQLQSDMVKDKQSVDRARKEAETLNQLYKEELFEMTQRAKSLSEQAKNSRKRATELQAARDEVTKLGESLEECEARLISQDTERAKLLECEALLASELATSSTEVKAARFEHETLSEILEQKSAELRAVAESSLTANLEKQPLEVSSLALALPEASDTEPQSTLSPLDDLQTLEAESKTSTDLGDVGVGHARRKVLECLSSVQQLVTDLQSDTAASVGKGELRATERSPRRQSLVSVKAAARGQTPRTRSAATEKSESLATKGTSLTGPVNKEVVARLAKQLVRLQQLVEGPEGRKGLAGVAGTGSPGGRATVRAVSPEGEHPLPEQDRRMYQQLSVDANEMMQQQLNDYRMAAEQIREEMMVQHCEELDDLVRRHDLERRELHHEIRELRVECQAKAGAEGSPVAAQFENQVAMMKRELVAQLSAHNQRESEQRSAAERELGQLRKSLEDSTKELASSQEEFEVLSELYDNTRREKQQLEATNRLLELRCEAARDRESADSGAQSLQGDKVVHGAPVDKVDKALIATSLSSYDMTPDNTGTWDSHANNVAPEQLGTQGEQPKVHSAGHERCNSINSDRLVASVSSQIDKIPETPHRTASLELARQQARGQVVITDERSVKLTHFDEASEKEAHSMTTSPPQADSIVTPPAALAASRVAAPARHTAPARSSIVNEEAVGAEATWPQGSSHSAGSGVITPTPSASAATPTVSVSAPSAAPPPPATSTNVLRAGSRGALGFSPGGDHAGALTPGLSRAWPVTMTGPVPTLSSPRAGPSSPPPPSASATAVTVAGASPTTLAAARASLRVSGTSASLSFPVGPVFERSGSG